MPKLEIELVTGSSRLAALKPEWDLLFEEMGDERSVFMSHLWYDCWWRHFGGDAELFLLVFRRNNQAVGIAPLMRRRLSLHGLPVRAVLFMANGNSLHNDLVVREKERGEVLRELYRFLSDMHSSWDLLQFNHVPANSPNNAGLLDCVAASRFRYRVSRSFDSPYLEIGGGWQPFLCQRSPRTRKALRNIINTLDRSWESAVSEVTSWEGFLSVRDEVMEVARKSWTQRVGDSLAHPVNSGFFEELAERAAERGWLSLWLLRLDGRLVAFEYHLRGCGKQHALRASFDEEYARFSPGTFLEAEILKRVFEAPAQVGRFDFGGSFDAYKKRWSDSSLNHNTLSIFNAEPYSRMVAFHELTVVDAARRVRNLWRELHGKH